MYYLLFYEKAEGWEERQKAFAAAHRSHLDEVVRRGDLLLAGNLHDPEGAAMLLFRAGTREAVEAVAQGDPYVREGVIARWYVREWDVVLGTLA